MKGEIEHKLLQQLKQAGTTPMQSSTLPPHFESLSQALIFLAAC